MPEEFVRRMQRGITGFEIPIARLEGKRKMSQNKSSADRTAIAAALRRSQQPGDREVANWMTETEPLPPGNDR